MPYFCLWDVLWAEMRVGTSSVFRSHELRQLIRGKKYSWMLNLQASLHSVFNFPKFLSMNLSWVDNFSWPEKKTKGATVSRKLLCNTGDFYYVATGFSLEWKALHQVAGLPEIFQDKMHRVQQEKSILREELTSLVSWWKSMSFSLKETKFSSVLLLKLVFEILLQCSYYLAAWLVLTLQEWC